MREELKNLSKKSSQILSSFRPALSKLISNNLFRWAQLAELLQYVESQEEFDTYSKTFENLHTFKNQYMSMLKSFGQYPRLWLLKKLVQIHFRQLSSGFDPTKAGLEVKSAIEAARKVGAKVVFLGNEIDKETREAFAHETRFNIGQYIFRRWSFRNSSWVDERNSMQMKFSEHEMRTFSEKIMDSYQMNWFIKSLELFFPNVKRIVVDQRDERIYRTID